MQLFSKLFGILRRTSLLEDLLWTLNVRKSSGLRAYTYTVQVFTYLLTYSTEQGPS